MDFFQEVAKAIAYVKNGLPKPQGFELGWIFAGLWLMSKGFEDFFDKKSIGTAVWKAIKKFALWPWTMEKNTNETKALIAKLTEEVTKIRSEVTVNGGTKLLKDVVLHSQERHLGNERKLEEILSMLNAQINIDSDMRFFLDNNGNMSKPNPAYLGFFGYSEYDQKNRGWEQQIHPDDLKTLSDNLHFSIKHHARLENTHRRRNNQWEWYLCRMTAEPIEFKGEKNGFIGHMKVIKKIDNQ